MAWVKIDLPIFIKTKGMFKIRFFKKKKNRSLSWFTKICLLFLILFVAAFLFRQLNSYLCLTQPINSKTLVVEGWLPDYCLEDLMEYYNENKIEQLIVTGIPLERGYYPAKYKTYADIAVATLAELGFDTSNIVKVNIPRSIFKDRTYNTALALREKIKSEGLDVPSFDIFTLGCHARRSNLLYSKAFRGSIEMGVVSATDQSYSYDKWWSSSRGFRTVTNEGIATLYASFFFNPDNSHASETLKTAYYIDSVNSFRQAKNLEFKDSLSSPLSKEKMKLFSGLKYFKPNPMYRVRASFETDTTEPVFTMQTTTDRLPVYRKYAKLNFVFNTDTFSLTAYQNMAFVNNEKYADYLFVPMQDLSYTHESYGGGRYLDLRITSADSIFVDFNLLYNPYCCYNSKYSCPVPPTENFLNIDILAGEKEFGKH
jgi:uncharacterized protein